MMCHPISYHLEGEVYMRTKRRGVVVVLVALLMITGTGVGAHAMLAGGDRLPAGLVDSGVGPPVARVTPAEPSSVAEAEAMIGATIPVPAYLPSGYAIQRIFVYEDIVVLMLSDGVITDPSPAAVLEPTFWEDEFKRRDGARLVIQMRRIEKIAAPEMWEEIAAGRTTMPGEVVDLGAVRGLLVDPTTIGYSANDGDVLGGETDRQTSDIWYLSWWHSMFQFDLKAPKDLSRDEVIKIASSVPVLSLYFKEVSLEEAGSIIGVEVPGVTLPPGYDVQKVFVWGDSAAYVLISDTEISLGKVETESELGDILAKPDQDAGVKMMLKVDAEVPVAPRPGIDLLQVSSEEGEILEFDGNRVISRYRTGYHDFEWLTATSRFQLKAVDQLSVDELGQIIGSAG